MKRKEKINYYFLYTIAFALTCLLVFFEYYAKGKSFIYDFDGWHQHYRAYLYYSDYLKEIANNLFVNHKLIIPQWNYSVGEGADILGTFHYYVIGDPIAFLALFVPTEYIYLLYDLGVILRLYISGLVFSNLCFYLNKSNQYAVLSGSLVYSFCFWNLLNSVRHIYFINPMIYMPLIILGVEKTIKEEKPLFLAVSVFLSCLSNFYYFYNMVILTVIYVAVRLPAIYNKNYKHIIRKLLLIFKYSLAGTLMAGVILFPIVYTFINDNRMSIDFGKHILYPISFYVKLPSILFSSVRSYWLCMGYSCPAVLALISSIIRKKKNITVFLLELLSIVFVLFPIFGQTLNGLSYISNKWCFALALLVSYIVVDEWENIKEQKKTITILFLIVSAICLFFSSYDNINILIPTIIGLFYILLLNMKEKSKFPVNALLIVLTIVNCACLGNIYYASYGRDYASTAMSVADVQNISTIGETYEFKEYIKDVDDLYFRYSGSDLEKNASLTQNTLSTDSYWSLSNPAIADYRVTMGIDEYRLYMYLEYDKRATLYSLANVKYYITPKRYAGLMPFDFSYIDSFGEYDLYLNHSYLPFGYSYDKSISYETWEKLSAVEKEEVLRKYIVIDEGKETNPEVSCRRIDYSIECYDDSVQIEGNTIKVGKDNASLTLKFSPVNNSALYFSIENMNYDDQKNWLKGKATQTFITISNSAGMEKEIQYNTLDDKYYNARSSFTSYLGYYDNEIDSLIVTFSNAGVYRFDDLYITLMPMDNYGIDIDALKEDVLENVSFETNKVSGSIDLSRNKYLLLSIPYSEGWKAYVDGKEAELLNANEAYMALFLDPGHHDIELKYETPFLKLGAVVSFVSTLFLIFDAIWIKKKKCRIKTN